MLLPLKFLICHFENSGIACYAVESTISPTDSLEMLHSRASVLFRGIRKLNGKNDESISANSDMSFFDLNLKRIQSLSQYGNHLPTVLISLVGCPAASIESVLPLLKNRIMQFPGIFDSTSKASPSHQGKNPIDVFVCHANADKELALLIVDYFNSLGYKTWCYERDSLPGTAHLEQSGKAIQESTCIVTLLSKDSIQSEFVLQELYTAIQFNKHLVPVTIQMTHQELENHHIKWAKIFGTTVSIEWNEESKEEILNKMKSGVDGIIHAVSSKHAMV